MRWRAACTLTTVALFFVSAWQAGAQWVSVDPVFPAGSGPDYYVRTIAVQTDGRVLVAGPFTNVSGVIQPFLARFNTNGTLDATFASQVNAEPTRVQSFADGRIFISGTFTNVSGVLRRGVAWLLGDGLLDASFTPPAGSGSAAQLNGVASPDGTVFVTGTFTSLDGFPRNRIARLLDTGAVDPLFVSPFAPTNAVTLLSVQPSGKPIVSGSFSNVAGLNVTNLVRLNLDGSVDMSFRSGLAPNERIYRTLMQPDGSLLATVASVADYGVPTSPQRLLRLALDGAVDAAFATTLESPGLLYSGGLNSFALQTDGRILLAGTFLRVNGTPRAKIARLESDGRLDYCFDLALADGLSPLALAAGADGTVLVGGLLGSVHGHWRPYLLRLLPPATCDSGVIEMGVTTLLAREDAPRVVVPVVRHGGGDLEQTVAFTTCDGSARGGTDYDVTSGTLHFAPGERSGHISIPLRGDQASEGPESFEVVLREPGGGASLGALTNTVVTLNDVPAAGTAGSPDTNYVVQLDGPVQTILPLADGGAILGGAFTNVNGQFCPNLTRLLADGSRDNSFVRTRPLDGEVRSLVLDAAGRVLVVGSFLQVDGAWQPGLARFETNGTLDAAFSALRDWPTNYYAAEVESIAVLADGSIVCGGYVPAPASSSDTRSVLLRFFESGEMDLAFTNHLPPNVTVGALTALPDGDFLVTGAGLGSSSVRLHSDGSLDFGFIPPADRQISYYASEMSLLPDGRVVVAGYASYLYGLPEQPPLWRLNPDGSLDTGFGKPDAFGLQGERYSLDKLVAEPDGRVVIAGALTGSSAGVTLARLQADGSLDASFGSGLGIQPNQSGYAYVNALASLPTGGWLVGGDFGGYDGFAQRNLVRVLPETLNRPLTFQFNMTNVTVWETNGPLTLTVFRRGDASGPAGVTVRTANGTAVAGEDFSALDVQLDFAPGEWSRTVAVDILDDLIAEGVQQFTVYLTNATGGFGLAQPSSVSVSIQSDDCSVSFTADEFHGVEEEGYVLVGVNWGGAVSSNSHAVVNIVPVTGHAEDLGLSSALVQYGVRMRSGTNSVRIPIVDNRQHDPSRQFRLELVGGPGVIPASRSNAWLTIADRDFVTSPSRGVAGVVEAIANAPGGGVYLAGEFTGVDGVPRNQVARLLPDGEVDELFDPGIGPNSNVTAVAVWPDGNVAIAGDFTTVSGVPRGGVARLRPDGSLDLTFDPGSGASHTNGTPFLRVLLPQNDGGLFVGGRFTHFSSRYGRLLTLLREDGSADTNFTSRFPGPIIGPVPQGPVYDSTVLYSLAQQSDGGLLAGGDFIASGGGVYVTPLYLAHLTSTGSLDSAFSYAMPRPNLSSVYSVVIRSDTRILVGTSSSSTWIPIQRVQTNGQWDATFLIRNAPAVSFSRSEVRQLLIQPDGRILFCAAITSKGSRTNAPTLDRVITGRLLPDGTWDASFSLVDGQLQVTQQPGPFWFNDPRTFGLPYQATLLDSYLRPVPTVFLARQPDGVLVLAGAFDSLNGEPRRRLARMDPDGALRGRLRLNLLGNSPLRLLASPEVETPYLIETSTDLRHWSGWLMNAYPWWPVELWLPPDEPVRFFRARMAE